MTRLVDASAAELAIEQARAEGRTEAANFLRAFADRHHQRGEGYAQQVDYGTGVEYGQACTCGADWGENERYDGCTERLEILAEADRIEVAELDRKEAMNERVRSAERLRVARYLECAAAAREAAGLSSGAYDAGVLREAAEWCREPSIWDDQEQESDPDLGDLK